MSLHWNIENVRDYDELTEGFEWTITEAMIFGTMNIGINKITEENADEVFVRLKMTEATVGEPFYVTDEDGRQQPQGWTREMVNRRIGLSTNASPLTKAKFHGNITRMLRQNAEAVEKAEA